MPKNVTLVIAAVMAVVFVVFLVLFFSVVRIWIRGLLYGVQVGIFDILGMRFRRVPPTLIVHTAILLREHKVAATVREIEQCYIAHGKRTRNATELARLVVEKRSASTIPDPK